MADITADLTKALKDAAYIGIGFGVLTFQRAQVQRRELQSQVDAQLDEAKGSFTKLSGTVEDRLKQLEERFEGVQRQLEDVRSEVESNLDKAMDGLSSRLPEPARDAFDSARKAARDAADQLRARAA